MGDLKGTLLRLGTRLHNDPWLLILASASIILSATPMAIIGSVISLWLAARIFRKYFGIITCLVVAYLVFSVYLAAFSALLWQVEVRLSNVAIALPWLLIIILLHIVGSHQPISIRPAKGEGLNGNDICALLLSIVVAVFVALPVISNASTATIAQAILGGGDNTVHLDLVKTINLNHGLIFGENNRYNTTPLASTYPQGWHVNIAYLKWLIDPLLGSVKPHTALLITYYVAAIFWLALFVYCLLAAAMYSVERTRYYAYIAVTPVIVVFCGWLISMYAYGHMPHIAATVYFILQLICTGIAYRDIKKKRRATTHPLMFLSLVCAVGAMLSYYYVAPLVAISFLVSYILYKRSARSGPTLPEVTAAIVAGYFALFPIVIRYVYAFLYHGGGQTIYDVSGLVAKSSFGILFLAYLGVIAGYLLLKKNRTLTLFVVATTALVMLSGGLRILYFASHDQPGYYLFKLNLWLIVILGLDYAVIINNGAQNLSKTMNKKTALAFCICLLLIGIQAANLVQSPVAKTYVQGTNFGMERRQADKLFEYMAKDPQLGDQIVFIGSCNRADDIRATQMARSLTPHKNTDYFTFPPTALGILDSNQLFRELQIYGHMTHNHTILLFNDQQTAARFKSQLPEDIKRYFTVVDMDPDYFQETVQQCPERIRQLSDDATA